MKSYILSYASSFGTTNYFFKTFSKIPFDLGCNYTIFEDVSEITKAQFDFLKKFDIKFEANEWVLIDEFDEDSWRIL